MDNSYRTSIEEIKKNLNQLQKNSKIKLLFFIVTGVTLFTLIIIYIILKCKALTNGGDYYDYYEDDSEVYPFDEDEFDEDAEDDAAPEA